MKDRFFVYCNESGFELFETLDDAIDAANERIQGYLEDAWSDEVASVCAGKITHRAKMCDQVFPDGEIDEDGIDEAGDYWDPDWDYKCNYKMLPVKSCEPIKNEDISERELFLCKGVMLDLAASDMKDPADGLMEFHFEDENGREGCFDVSIAEYAAKTAAILDSISTNQPAPAFSDEDHVYIPRGLIAAACSAIDKKRDGEKTIAELRRYTTGDLSRQPAPEVAKLVESLEVAHRFIANGIELGYIQMPDSDTLDPAHETLPAIEAALAEYRTQGGDV